MEPRQVTRNSVVLVIARGHLPEPRTDGRNWLVTAALQLRFDCLELGYHPLLGRLSPHDERSIFPALPAIVRKAQKCEGLWLSLPPLLSVRGGEPPELDQPRLLRM